MNNFEREGNPLKQMDLGGFSFDTMKPGAILQSKKYFGITASSGQIAGHHDAKISVRNGDFFLITSFGYNIHGERETIHFLKSSELLIKLAREKIKEGANPNSLDMAFHTARGFLKDLTKKRFDYRFDVIEVGFNESKKSI